MRRKIRIYRENETTFEVCPWQYQICQLIAGEKCPVRDKVNGTKDIAAWEKATTKASGCKYRGETVTPRQYEHHRMGIIV